MREVLSGSEHFGLLLSIFFFLAAVQLLSLIHI